MGKKKPPVFFAATHDGRLFVKAAALMSPLVYLIDGLPLVFFGGGKTAYLKIDVAIEWAKKEALASGDPKYGKAVEYMEKAKIKLAEEPISEVP